MELILITKKWNNSFINNTKSIGKFNLCLEIGCFEGATSSYIAANLLNDNGKLICVDPLSDQYLNENLIENSIKKNNEGWKYFKNQHERFQDTCKEYLENGKIKLIRKLSTSPECRKELEKYGNNFDFIYVDGDHRKDTVYKDAVLAYDVCVNNGYILFDDYQWCFDSTDCVYMGVDKFINDYSPKIKVLFKNYQVMIQKIY